MRKRGREGEKERRKERSPRVRAGKDEEREDGDKENSGEGCNGL